VPLAAGHYQWHCHIISDSSHDHHSGWHDASDHAATPGPSLPPRRRRVGRGGAGQRRDCGTKYFHWQAPSPSPIAGFTDIAADSESPPSESDRDPAWAGRWRHRGVTRLVDLRLSTMYVTKCQLQVAKASATAMAVSGRRTLAFSSVWLPDSEARTTSCPGPARGH
jgi:hypothetical protein